MQLLIEKKEYHEKRRPNFDRAWHAFIAVRLPVKAVGEKIGGNVKKNIDLDPKQGGFTNACPIRMSYVLNSTGFLIPRAASYKSVSNADGHQYRVPDMMAYLEHVFGKPDKTVKMPKPSDFAKMRGIIVVKGHGWDNAVGHVTLWNGFTCADSCHLLADPDNGRFVPDIAAIWIFP